jgi:hypothetical protein
MNPSRSLLLFLSCALAYSQNSNLFDKAPPGVDETLRARVTIFYDAHVSGKFHEALKVVEEDMLDAYLGASNDTYKGCEIGKINYSEAYTKATVVTACKGEYRWHGSHMPVTIPLISTWRISDGQWFWYHIHETEVETPWGISRETPENSTGPAQMPSIPPDPNALARRILSQVSIDTDKIELKGSELSQGEIHVTNQMTGVVTISVDKLPLAGMNVKIDNPEIPAGGKTTIHFIFDPNDPSINCNACMAHVQLPTLTANVRVAQTSRVFPVKITFALESQAGKSYALPK